jgi:hypothetical protein
MQLIEQLDVINAALAESHRLASPLSEVRSIEDDPSNDAYLVKGFGLNQEPVTYRVTFELMDEDLLVAQRVEG